MAYKVILSPRAIRDLERIVRYIAPHNRRAAEELGQALINKTKALGEFPELGRRVPEFANDDIRELVFRSYRIVYRLNRQLMTAEVSRFWHGARGTPDLSGS